nr:GNAT family N-acetyltransferase [Rhabdothermincola salaria]
MAADVVWTLDQLDEHLFGPQPAAQVTLACDDTHGGVVGMALWFRTFSTFLGRPGIWLEDLFVRPEARGRGHGLALLRHLRSLTDGRVEWSVLDWNTPSIELYEQLGARPLEGWTTYRWLGDGPGGA